MQIVWTYIYICTHTYRERERESCSLKGTISAHDYRMLQIGFNGQLERFPGCWIRGLEIKSLCASMFPASRNDESTQTVNEKDSFLNLNPNHHLFKKILACACAVFQQETASKSFIFSATSLCRSIESELSAEWICFFQKSSIPRLLPIPGLLAFTNQGNYQLGISQLSNLLNVLYPVYQFSLIF